MDNKSWPPFLDTDDLPKRKLQVVYRAPTPEMLCYLDFSVSTTGMLAGVKVTAPPAQTLNVSTPRPVAGPKLSRSLARAQCGVQCPVPCPVPHPPHPKPCAPFCPSPNPVLNCPVPLLALHAPLHYNNVNWIMYDIAIVSNILDILTFYWLYNWLASVCANKLYV